MAQHDFVISNAGFPATRADINNFLQAVATTHSGTSTPSGAVAGTIWLDTTTATAPILKYYDGTDNITLATIDHVANTVNFSDSALDLITDTTPQLGGNLDVNGNSIVSTSNANITLAPNGTGDVVLSADTVKIGDANANATITTDGTGDLILNTNSGSSSGSITIADGANGNITIAGNGTGQIVVNAGAVGTPTIAPTGDLDTGIFFPSADTIAFTEGGAEAMRINSDGNVALAKNIGLGGATPTTSGTGITFPATASGSTNANTLDDYEEGTFTPEMRPTSGGSYSFGTTKGRYIKVGSLVTLHGFTEFSSVTTAGSGDLNLQGLPFANLNTGDAGSRSALCIGNSSSFTTNNPSTGAFEGNGGGTQIKLKFRSSANGASSTLAASAMATGANITFSITYTTA